MASAVDGSLGFYRDVLALRGYRQEVLAADIANANTPGYKAIDLDFEAALAAARKSPAAAAPSQAGPRLCQVSDPRHVAAVQSASVRSVSERDPATWVKYQADNQVTLDGNSVDLDKAKVAAAANAVNYAAAVSFTTQSIRMLSTAIGGAASAPNGG